MCQHEGNDVSTCLEGLVHPNVQNPSKQVEKPFPSRWHILLACSWLSLYFLYHGKNEANTKETKTQIFKGNTAKEQRKMGYSSSNDTTSHSKSPHSPNYEQIVLWRYVLYTLYCNNVIYVYTVDTLVL